MFGFNKKQEVVERKPPLRLTAEERRVVDAETRLGRAVAALRDYDSTYAKIVNGTRMVALGSPPRRALDVELEGAKLEFNRALSAWANTKEAV